MRRTTTRRVTGSLIALAVGASLGLAATGSATARQAAAPASSRHASAASSSAIPLPEHDPFYRYTGRTPLAKVKPGTVLKKRAITLNLGGKSPSPIPAEQLLYRTQDEQQHPSVTVTTVVNPTGVATGIVAYLSFYDALGSECDPSFTLRGGYPGTSGNASQSNIEESLIAGLVAQGYAVTVPDFEGEKLHWVAGQESGWNTLDSVRATESYLGDPAATTKVGLYGYSGGSIAGEWASELAPHYSPELDIVGTAIGGIPVDLAHNLLYVDGSPDWSGVIPATLVSLGRAFGLPVKKYASPYGLKLMRTVHDQCIGSFNGAYPGLKAAQLVKKQYADLLKVPAFVKIVNHLIMGSTPGHPTMPMYLAVGNGDGKGDGVMIVRDVEALAHEYCTQGVQLQFQTIAKSDHTQAGAQFFPQGFDWLAQRFAGSPMVSNCSSVGTGNSLAPVKVRHHRQHHQRQHHQRQQAHRAHAHAQRLHARRH